MSAAKCVAKVRKGEGWHRYSVPCEKNALAGKEYCGIHDPERLKAKAAERDAKWRADSDAAKAKAKREREILKACEGLTVEQVKAALTSEAKSAEPPQE